MIQMSAAMSAVSPFYYSIASFSWGVLVSAIFDVKQSSYSFSSTIYKKIQEILLVNCAAFYRSVLSNEIVGM